MATHPIHGRIDGPIVMIGFGSIGKGTLPLIERHFHYDKSRFVVIDPEDKDRKLLDERGIRHSGDITKAMAAGASGVMLGSLLAGLHESPGDIVIREGRSFKEYRGMGSLGAMKGRAADRYMSAQRNGDSAIPDISGKSVPEGIEGRVAHKGSVAAMIHQLVGGLRAGMGYCGCASIPDLQRGAQLVRITPAGMREGHVHDVAITKEAPNYRSE